MDDRKPNTYRTYAQTPDRTFWLGRAPGIAPGARDESPAQEPFDVEPRHELRRHLGLQVLINHGMAYSAPSRVRDLSLTGAFVEAEMEGACADLPLGAYVEVVLRYRYRDEPREHRLPATVTRLERHGMALRFGHYDDQAYTDLVNLLYAQG